MFANWLLPGASRHHERLTADRREKLFAGLVSGSTVVELGPGTGPNFRYYPPRIRWTGIEPNPHLHRFLPSGAGLRASLRDFEPASVDAVVSTLVLCSVPDPAAILLETVRVLRPGGVFLFLEHVAAPCGTAKWKTQRRIAPVWKWCADGCNPDRDTIRSIRGTGFGEVTVEEFELPELGPVAPHIVGSARKQD